MVQSLVEGLPPMKQVVPPVQSLLEEQDPSIQRAQVALTILVPQVPKMGQHQAQKTLQKRLVALEQTMLGLLMMHLLVRLQTETRPVEELRRLALATMQVVLALRIHLEQ
jgi:hypothetical protein